MTEKTFQQVMQEFMNRYGNKDYAEALDLLNQEQERFPAQAPQFYYNRACMLGVQKRVPETLAVLREADERGFFFDADTMHKDTDFESLLGNPEFEKLVESFQTRHAQRQGQVSSSRLVVEPPGVAQASSVPLLLVLHGNGSSAAASEPYWKPAAAAGWLVGLVQSSQLGFSESAFVWNDEVRSLQDIETQLAEINKAYPVDPKRVIVGGFSMGGGIAALLGLTQPFRRVVLLALGHLWLVNWTSGCRTLPPHGNEAREQP